MKIIKVKPTVSAATSFTSPAYDLGDCKHWSLFALFSGSNVVGTLKFQYSNDGTNFVDATDSDVSKSVTGSGEVYWDKSNVSMRYVRFDWTYTSGTGNITLDMIMKASLAVVG